MVFPVDSFIVARRAKNVKAVFIIVSHCDKGEKANYRRESYRTKGDNTDDGKENTNDGRENTDGEREKTNNEREKTDDKGVMASNGAAINNKAHKLVIRGSDW